MKSVLRILHISKIDNDHTKGTSVVIPQYVISQQNQSQVGLLNCNDIVLDDLKECENIFSKTDNEDMNVLKNFRPNLVVFHEIYKPDYIFIYRYCVKFQIPYIIIPHGSLSQWAQNHKKLKKVLGNFFFFSSFLSHAASVQYLSDNERNMTSFPQLPYFIQGNGFIDIPKNNLYINKLSNQDFQFIYVGRYDYEIKGLDQLLLACFEIKEQMVKNHIKLCLYGSGSENEINKIKQDVLRYGLEKIVFWHGPIYGEDKRKVILDSQVFVQVSRSEGQPLGVMEAMSLGMPLLLSSGTGYQSIISETNCGYCVSTTSQEIAAAMLKMYQGRHNLSRMSESSYKYAKIHYSWDYVAKKTLKKYQQFI